MSTFVQHRPLMVAFVEALAQAERVPELRAGLAECYERLRATVAAMVLGQSRACPIPPRGRSPRSSSRCTTA